MGQTYLVRFAESGRDAQPERQGVRRDLAQVLAAALPGARIATESGRLLVDAGGEAASVLADLPGVASFSPCRRVALGEVAEAAIAAAAEALPRGGSFCVRVKLVGAHALRSRDLAIQVGGAIAARLPGLEVDLRRPDAVIGIEVRGAECFVFHQVVPGVDRCGPSLRSRPPAAPIRSSVRDWTTCLSGSDSPWRAPSTRPTSGTPCSGTRSGVLDASAGSCRWASGR